MSTEIYSIGTNAQWSYYAMLRVKKAQHSIIAHSVTLFLTSILLIRNHDKLDASKQQLAHYAMMSRIGERTINFLAASDN